MQEQEEGGKDNTRKTPMKRKTGKKKLNMKITCMFFLFVKFFQSRTLGDGHKSLCKMKNAVAIELFQPHRF